MDNDDFDYYGLCAKEAAHANAVIVAVMVTVLAVLPLSVYLVNKMFQTRHDRNRRTMQYMIPGDDSRIYCFGITGSHEQLRLVHRAIIRCSVSQAQRWEFNPDIRPSFSDWPPEYPASAPVKSITRPEAPPALLDRI